MNRYTRDELLSRALDLIDSSALDQKDRPRGVIEPNALTIGFLQDGLDFFHNMFPFTGLVKKQTYTFSGTTDYTLPTDFIHDCRDGVRVLQTDPKVKIRLLRKSQSWILGRDTTRIGQPYAYLIRGKTLVIFPTPDKSYTGGELWYFAMPAPLDADDIPEFPDDWTLIEYVRYRGKEWTGELPAGEAIKFCTSVVAKLQASGLGNEADNDALELDHGIFRPTGSEAARPWDWMGPTTIES